MFSPVDDRTGLIRWAFDIPIEPGEPSIHNASVKMADTTRYARFPCYDNNGGSGLTRRQARDAAIGEGLERYCCAIFDPADLICGSLNELAPRYDLVEPSDFALFHPDQPGAHPRPGPDTQVAWVHAWRLGQARAALVPASLVYMPYFPCFPERNEQVVAPAVSTGLACARSLDQALLNGLYELLERDAFMITWYNRLPVPRVDVSSHAQLRSLYELRLQRDGLRYEVFRTASDLPIPSFLCVLIDERRSPPMICVGGAAGLDPVRAAAKAMTEAVQTREWAKFLGARGRTFAFAPDFSDIEDFEDHVALYAYGDMLHALDFLLENGAEPYDNWTTQATGDPVGDLEIVRAALAAAGLDVLALDLTTVDVAQCGCHVARAMVPRLQPLDASYAHRFLGGQRLYEVPRRLGYTTKESTIDTLNPYPHPFP